jgi:hypothetical protein
MLLFMALMVVGTLMLSVSSAAGRNGLQSALKEHYRPSRVEIQDWRTAGRVREVGSVLTLQADGVTAHKFWVSQPPSTKYRRLHTFDYARSEISEEDRLLPARSGWTLFTLPKGTRLVVLDLNVEDDRVHLFTHTLEPVRLAKDDAVYGCPELVFRFAPGILQRSDLATIERRIEQWLPLGQVQS